MPFSVEDFQDLVRLLEQRPDWRAELRRLVLSEELLELPALARRQAEAQERTEQRLDRIEAALVQLAEAQVRAEQRLDRVEAVLAQLAEAQARTDQRLDQVESALVQLAEAQARTQEQLVALVTRMDSLDRGHQRLRHDLGVISQLVGARAEAEARPLLTRLLKKRGYRLLHRFRPVSVDGEVDVAAPVQDAEGNRLWVLLEARARLRRGDVQEWHRRLQNRAFLTRLKSAGVMPPLLAYAFGIQVYEDAEAAGHATGIGILADEGELVAAVPRPA